MSVSGEAMNGRINDEHLLKPPSDEEVGQALLRFAKDVDDHYGSDLAGLYLYGSRARAEHHLESDADLVVILSKDFDFLREVSVLSDLSYDYLVDRGICIDAKPVALMEWNDPSSHVNPSLVRAMRRDCKAIGTKS
ncbi:MAG: nucleotidyltransferase domain-containing protein [Methylocella sp.]